MRNGSSKVLKFKGAFKLYTVSETSEQTSN